MLQGDNERLRMVLYGPDSLFDKDIVQRYKAGKPVAVPDPNGISEYKTPQKRKRPRPGSESTADSTASVVRQARVNSLGNGWYLKYDSVTELLPATAVAGPLRDFYTGVTTSAADQLGAGTNATDNLAFKSGPFSLELSSQEPIGWDYVINFAAGMMDMLSPQFTPVYRGEVVSTFWVLPSVQVSLGLVV